MIQQGVGYTVTNSSGGQSLVVDFPPSKQSRAFFVYEDTTTEGITIFKVEPGTINNQLPTINGISIALPTAQLSAPAESSYVILNIPNSGSAFPSAQSTITTATLAAAQESDNDTARLKIAVIYVETPSGSEKVYTVSSLIGGSLSATRFSDQLGVIIYYFSLM